MIYFTYCQTFTKISKKFLKRSKLPI